MKYFLDIRARRGAYRVHSLHETLDAAAWAMRQHLVPDGPAAARIRDAFTGEVLAHATRKGGSK